MKTGFHLLIFLCIVTAAFSQDTAQIRQDIRTLCQPAFHGRGYVLEGDRKAANWLSHQFEDLGLKKFGESYQQRFVLPVQTFPQNPSLRLGKKTLRPGTDFIPDPATSAGEGALRLLALDTAVFSDADTQKAWLKKDLSRYALWYTPAEERKIYELPETLALHLLRVPLTVIIQENLVFGVAEEPRRLPTLRVRKAVFPSENPPKKLRFHIRTQPQPSYTSQNVIAYVEGTETPEHFIAFSAHYDHLGGWGESVYFPGANDNASGTATLLELARYYAENPPKRSVVFMAFGGEEAGLKGSRYYVDNPSFPLKNIDFLLNLDLLGTGETGATLVNGKIHTDAFERLRQLNEEYDFLPGLKARGAAPNSDHHFFHLKGVPSFFIYLTTHEPEKLGYHSPDDTPEKLSLAGVPGLINLLKAFVPTVPVREE